MKYSKPAPPAQRHPLAAQIARSSRRRLPRRDEEGHVGRQSHDASNVVRSLPAFGTAHGEIGDRGVGEREVEIAARQPADVLLGALGRLGGHLPGSLDGGMGVQNLAERPADDEEGAARRGRADAEEMRLGWRLGAIIARAASSEQGAGAEGDRERAERTNALHRGSLAGGDAD